MSALPSPAIPAVTLSRRLPVASGALLGDLPSLAGRLCASGLFGWVAVESKLTFSPYAVLGLLQSLARGAASEKRPKALQGCPSILIACGNRVMLPSDAAASTCNPSTQEV